MAATKKYEAVVRYFQPPYSGRELTTEIVHSNFEGNEQRAKELYDFTHRGHSEVVSIKEIGDVAPEDAARMLGQVQKGEQPAPPPVAPGTSPNPAAVNRAAPAKP